MEGRCACIRYIYIKEHCIVRAIIFYMIIDFLVFDNMSGLKTKGARAYPICREILIL
jgi:hypothetical protein